MNSITWIIWLIATLIALSSTRNPIHLLFILILLILMMKLSRANSQNRPFFQFSIAPFISLVIISAGMFNAFTSHIGTTILLTIPGTIPLISGAITIEAILYGVTNGLMLCGIFLVFIIFNQSLGAKSIIRLIPKAFYPIALIISIAINFLPNMMRRIEEIRQAQAIRGNPLNKLTDYIGLFVPLLIDSLERSMQMAEAMTARGFIPPKPKSTPMQNAPIIFGGLLIFITGWILEWISGKQYYLGFSFIGLFLILAWFWWISRKIPQTVYKHEHWESKDAIIIFLAILSAAGFLLPLPFLNPETLIYSAYPTVTLPGFSIPIGILSLGLMAPIISFKRQSNDQIS